MKPSITLATFIVIALLLLTALNSAWAMLCISVVAGCCLLIAKPVDHDHTKSLLTTAVACVVAIAAVLIVQLL